MKKISIQTVILPQDMNMEEEAKRRKGPDLIRQYWFGNSLLVMQSRLC